MQNFDHKLRSQRVAQPPELYTYKIEPHVRKRIIHTLAPWFENRSRSNLSFQELTFRVYRRMYRAKGELPGWRPSSTFARPENDPEATWNHFIKCSDKLALDYIEAFFCESEGILDNDAVDSINEIFQEEGVGYELTHYRTEYTGETVSGYYGPEPVARIVLPEIISKSESYLHSAVVRPCLHALAHPDFSTALKEMTDAHLDYKQGRYDGAITLAGSAYESTMKTICKLKGWKFSPSDTCGTLVDICHKHELFPAIYTKVLKSVCLVRNELGDAHGKGHTPKHTTQKVHADHMLQTTSANITFLMNLAGFYS